MNDTTSNKVVVDFDAFEPFAVSYNATNGCTEFDYFQPESHKHRCLCLGTTPFQHAQLALDFERWLKANSKEARVA
jgi:hypothetical protein